MQWRRYEQVAVDPLDTLGEISALDAELDLCEVGLDVPQVEADKVGVLWSPGRYRGRDRSRGQTRALTGQAVAASITQRPLPHPRSSTFRGGSGKGCMVTPLQRRLRNMQFQSSLRNATDGGVGESREAVALN